jgi:signal peptidase I
MALTGSMRGTIEGGDFVLINQSFPYSRLRIGDIVAFHCDTIVIHRVIGEAPARTGQLIDRHALKTQGDALPRPDPTVLNCDTYIGKVTAIVHNDLRLTDADEIGRTWASGK